MSLIDHFEVKIDGYIQSGMGIRKTFREDFLISEEEHIMIWNRVTTSLIVYWNQKLDMKLEFKSNYRDNIYAIKEDNVGDDLNIVSFANTRSLFIDQKRVVWLRTKSSSYKKKAIYFYRLLFWLLARRKLSSKSGFNE